MKSFSTGLKQCDVLDLIVTSVALWLFSQSLTSPVLALPDANTIEFNNCTLSLPGTIHTTRAQCGWLEVAEDPEHPDGNTISLHVALATAVSRTPEADPLFVFAGGPGGAASEFYVMLQPVLEKIRKTRDIVLIDQRGTGQSSPMKCPLDETESLDAGIDLEVVAQHTRDCLTNLKGDPRFYTTTIAMADYDLVRQAMGYEQINLFGVSYGTRAAQVYLRHYAGHVRSIILDSVVPMQLNLGQEHAQMLDRAVAEVFRACEREQQCHDLYAEGIKGLDALFRQLRQQPREISFTHPATGIEETIVVTSDILAVAIRFLSYSSETQAILPLLIHEAVTKNNLERLTIQAMLIVGDLNEQISRGMELSVICSEDYPYLSFEQDNSSTILGDTFLSVLKTTCEIWPRGKVTAQFHEPVKSDVPVLLLTGNRDPVTPPSYAQQTALHFSNSLVLTAEGLGHGVTSNYCMREIAADFMEQGSTKNIDTTCVAAIKPAPFFTTILGPGP
jgi:pimeloyl-ACP methyl ester carboxylesterase